jgi:hypothetical protein
MADLNFLAETQANTLARLLADALSVGNRGRVGFTERVVPFASEVCGVGVASEPDNPEKLSPIVLLDSGMIQERTRLDLARVAEVPSLRNLLSNLLPNQRFQWETALVAHVSTPQLTASTGDSVHSAKRGTAGAKVIWGQPAPTQQGLVTAGHVVGANPQATIGGSTGNVVFASDIRGSGLFPKADVAVVEFPSTVTLTSCVKRAITPAAGSSIDILVGTSSKTPQIIGKLLWLYFPSVTGTAGEVYFVFPGVTAGGDSGAVATVTGTPTHAIGHHIGGSGTSASYVQDIQYQLAAIGSTLPNLRI